MKNNKTHEPVMVHEVLKYLKLEAPLKKQVRKKYIDATLGTGGYTEEIVKKGGDVLSFEADKEMVEVAKERLEAACPTPEETFGGSFKIVNANFKDIDSVASNEDFKDVDGIVYDLGVSSPQLTSEERGFSFSNPDAELDMRINPDVQGLKASDLLNALREDQLERVFQRTMGKSEAKKLSTEIVKKRERKRFENVGDFLAVTEKVVIGKKGLHPATQAFLALRMATNSELENLEESLPKAYEILAKGGRLVVVSFHSGEDKVVKDFFKKKEKEGAKVLTDTPLSPRQEEIKKNPRSRSAKLRALEK